MKIAWKVKNYENFLDTFYEDLLHHCFEFSQNLNAVSFQFKRGGGGLKLSNVVVVVSVGYTLLLWVADSNFLMKIQIKKGAVNGLEAPTRQSCYVFLDMWSTNVPEVSC